MPSLDKNILVISDLHLGEDLKPGAAAQLSYWRHLARLERELERFLAHYTAQRLDTRPWRLVINGDMVDFMSICILPDGESASVEEKTFGLGYGEEPSAQKLARVFERHAGVFRRLGEFVAAGNELVVIVGNHDAEFWYPGVQRMFVDRLGDLVRQDLSTAVRFCPWFYYQEEVVWVEHGHQYDEYCSFDYQLHPVEPVGGIALSLAHAGVRYFSNLVPSLDPHESERWGFVDWMRWGAAHGVRGLAHIFYLYLVLSFKLIEIKKKLTDPASDGARRALHKKALGALAGQYRLAVEQLEALDRLKTQPVVRRVGGILRALFLDRILVGAGLIVALGVVALATSGWWRLASLGAVLAAGGAVHWALGRVTRMLPSADALRRAPDAIRRIVRAPFVVFGHSHTAERVQLAGGGTYFNTGTWTAGDEECGFPHLVIHAAAQSLVAELRAWRDGATLPMPDRDPAKS